MDAAGKKNGNLLELPLVVLHLSLAHFDLLFACFFPCDNGQRNLQYSINILCSDRRTVDAVIQSKGPYKTSAAVFPHDPVGSGKTFRWCVRNRKLITIYTEMKILFDTTGCEDQHFKTGFGPVNIYGSSLNRT